MLQFIPRLQNRRMHLLHRIPQLHPEPTQDIPLPRIILCVHSRLHLLVINHAHPKRLLRLGCIECRAGFLDLCEELLPVCEILAEAVEDVFGFEVPKGLELEPFGDVVSEVLDFDLDQGEWSLEGIVRETGQLRWASVSL
jgi:hypothetical protein